VTGTIALGPLDERKAGRPGEREVDVARGADPVGAGRQVPHVERRVTEPSRDLDDLHRAVDTTRTVEFRRNRSASTVSVLHARTAARGAHQRSRFHDAGEYDIFCDIHSDMNAVVKVVESEWMAEVTDGAFTIRNVPAGDYRLVAWMPNSTEVTETITVTEGGTVTSPTLNLQAPKLAGAKPHKRKDGTDYPVRYSTP
jgi:hypothetical protein